MRSGADGPEVPASAPTSSSPRPSLQRLRELFERVLEMAGEEREAEIARLTVGAPELASDLRAMVELAERENTALDNSALRLDDYAELFPRIPGFRIARRIGRGGSATVYLAEQVRPDFSREVALKVIDRVVDSASRRRVSEEQRILARLEHPGIARLYDAGVTPAGQPYLAMEHVEGESILEHCRSHELPVRQRVELFLSVLAAVDYAHRAGIVHRDLKPANILVSARGEAKLLDFGIAKLVANPGEEQETQTLRRAMTPAYASPEQVRGERVTASSDIYSLGVVLYELLADTLPYRLDGKRFETFEDAIREQDPEPPSSAVSRTASQSTGEATARGRMELLRRRRALRGDLDSVLLKALRKVPTARYASAAELAEDLRRVLAEEPVSARRGGWRYRAGKFVRRHRRGMATAALVIVGLGVLSLPRVRRLWLGESAAGPATEMAIYGQASGVDGETRRALVAGADQLAHFDGLAARASFQRAVSAAGKSSPAAALAWDGVARSEGALGELGRAADAAITAGGLAADLPELEIERLRARATAVDGNWTAAIPALEGVFARLPGRIDVGLDLSSALLAAGRTDAAADVLGRLRQLPGQLDGPAADPRIDLAEAEVSLRSGEFQRSAAAAARVVERAKELGAVALGVRAERIHAESLARLDRREEARTALEALVPRAAAAGLAHEEAAVRLALGVTLTRLASNQEAREALESALTRLRATGDARGEVTALVQLGLSAGKRGEMTEGRQLFRDALATARRIGDRWSEGVVLSQRMVLLNWADDVAGVQADIEPALAALRESGNRQTLLGTLCNMAIVHIENVDLQKAEAYIDEAEAIRRRVGSQLVSAALDRARAYLEQTRGNLDLARQSYTAALDKARSAGTPLVTANYLADLAWVALQADRPEEAENFANEAITTFLKAGDQRQAANTEAVLAWVEARRGDARAAHRRLRALQSAAANEDSDASRYTFLSVEAQIAEVLGDWKKAAELRHQTIRITTDWKTTGLLIDQQVGLARALHGIGDRAALEKLTSDLLPQAERLGLYGVTRDLRALLAAPAKKG